ncbi:MAG TPA: hypothetical protein VF544_11080 [Pyrinomonadaceae bacterium]|jgi:hypothetical protein
MVRRFIALLIWGCLTVGSICAQTSGGQGPQHNSLSATPGAAAAPQPSRPPADPHKFALIISGASGEEAYAKQFAQWTEGLRRALTERLGFGQERVKILAEQATEGGAGRSTAVEVTRALEALRLSASPNSTVFIFLIGHGTFDGKEAKFNLVGPDLPVAAYNNLLKSLPAERIVIFNMASASGEFVKPLAARGRVIITATRSGQEQNATRFAEHFIAALTEREADTDQNGRISILEAFNYATLQTAGYYKRAGRLATEHALLEDNGDGVGHQAAEGGDGAVARVTYLDSLSVEQAAANAHTLKLLRERTRLDEEIAQLKARKAEMPSVEYEAALERMLIELAKVSRDIRKAGQ